MIAMTLRITCPKCKSTGSEGFISIVICSPCAGSGEISGERARELWPTRPEMESEGFSMPDEDARAVYRSEDAARPYAPGRRQELFGSYDAMADAARKIGTAPASVTPDPTDSAAVMVIVCMSQEQRDWWGKVTRATPYVAGTGSWVRGLLDLGLVDPQRQGYDLYLANVTPLGHAVAEMLRHHTSTRTPTKIRKAAV